MLGWMPVLVLWGCSITAPSEDTATGGTLVTEPIENPFGEPKGCRTFKTGTVSMKAAGYDRTLQVELPDDPNGAPVVFVWHWLGGNATEILTWMEMSNLATDGYIVVAPEASGTQLYEWDTLDTSDDNLDLALMDKVLPCLFDQFQIAPDRIYATGFSAGGLMSSFLTAHRANVLAATAPFSGGADPWNYETPSQPIHSLVTWGGPTDTYGTYSFHDSSLYMIDQLNSDGSTTFACEHTGGHTWPSEAVDMARQFFDAHAFGVESPWTDGLPDDMPSFCSTTQ